uniref:NAD(P)H-quinone oxidoreductase chain 4, chloroplastic n=2 Tax=Ophioglossum TaxID=13833 RepID=L7T1Q1_9MONI|nr:NAD(P)H-quinone oxidoreductase chain 4 [Ophioglossum californicum]AGC26759.1 NAD(P)H-quinone oxidoreductase chain 4 [Ophioglossum californicum]QXF60132.1 NADH dehydrogenase subunit 4 [Ophioglossum vulgatum]
MSNLPWLTIIVLLPTPAGSSIPFLPSANNRIIRWYALGICLLEFLLITYVFSCQFRIKDESIQLLEDYVWIGITNFHWRLGVDGLSMSLILLTGFVTTPAILAAWPVTRNTRLFHFSMLAMYSGQIGLFASQDLLLFFLMWELELIPIYLLLSIWGGKRRIYSATKFLLYTAGGSLFLLLASLTMGLYGSYETSFDIQILAKKSYPITLEIILYLGFLITYAVKLPIYPFHTWLPDTHGEAHYSTCMLLAGILLKMGGYGLIRINMELLPHAHSIFSPWLVTIGAIQILYASLISFSQRNLKRRIAYSSVSHMGFVTIGIGSITSMGLNGAMLQMISHGLIGAALFFLAGTSYDRTRTLLLNNLGGLAIPMPKLFVMFSFFSLASLALPGTSGFVAESMVFLGVITNNYYSSVLEGFVVATGAIGTVLTPIYLLSMLRQMFYGYRISNVWVSYLIDIGPRETFIMVCLLLPIIGIGIYPNLVLSLWKSKVESISYQYN